MDNRSEVISLIRQFQSGDVDSFNEIYEKTYRLVYTTCYGILRSQEDAEDVTQDTFIKIYEKLALLQAPETYVTWMIRIASNKCIDYCRQSRNITYTDNDAELDIYADDWTEIDGLPDSFIEEEEKKEIINRVLKESLSEVQYQTLFMHYFNNMPVEDIATVMECPEGTVKTRLKSARTKFKEALEVYVDKNKIVLGAAPFLTRFFVNQMPSVPNTGIVPLNYVPAITSGALTATSKAVSSGAKTGILSTVAGKIAVGAVALAGIAAVSVGGYFLLAHKPPEVINMNDYITYSVSGYDSQGKIEYKIDYEKLIEDYPSLSAYDTKELERKINGQWNKTDRISNFDKLTFTWKDNASAKKIEEEANVDLVFDPIYHEVSELKTNVVIDPFQYLEVSFEGSAPDGKAVVKISKDNPDNSLSFDLSKSSGLSNGDVITVTANGNADGFAYSKTKQEYTVKGLNREVIVKDKLLYDKKDIDWDNTYDLYEYNKNVYMPEVMISGVDTKEINAKIMNYCAEEGFECYGDPGHTDDWGASYNGYYEYYVHDNCLSLILEGGTGTDGGTIGYKIMNVNIDTGEIMSKEEFLQSISLSAKDFEQLVETTVNDTFPKVFKKEYFHFFDGDFMKIYGTKYEDNFDPRRISNAEPYYSSRGHLCFAYLVCGMGADSFQNYCFDTETREIQKGDRTWTDSYIYEDY